MANFLDDLSVYNAKAALVISQVVADGYTDKANMMSSLKTTANDTTLTEAARLAALTALINLGSLLDIPLPPYFPLTVTYANTQEYIGIHNDLTGLQGGAPGDYQHLTSAERSSILGKASLNDITFANLLDSYTNNAGLDAAINGKQTQLSGTGFVKASGTTITYDNSTYLTSVTLAATALSGELSGTIGNPTVNNAAVISKQLTGWNGGAAYTAITATDTILAGMEKLNARISSVIASPGGVSSIAGATNVASILSVAASHPTGAVTFSVSLSSQSQNLFLASPNGTSGTPGFRAIAVADLPNSGATAATYGSASLIPVIAVDAKGRITAISNITANSGGLVNTVSLTGPAIFNNYASTVGANPQLSFNLTSQVANTVWAGPASGANAAPQFRTLVQDDVPFLAGIVSGLQNQIDSRLPQSLNTSLIYMGNGSGVAAQSVVGGDLTAAYAEPGNVNTATFTIANGAVTYAKFANIPDSALNTVRPILLGRFSSGQGPMQQLTLSGDFTLNSGTGEIGLLTPNPPELTDAGDLLTSSGANVLERLSLPVDYSTKGYLLVPYTGTTSPDIKLIWGEAGGDITYSINTTGTPFPEFAIGANKVTLGKMQQLPAYTVIGNDTSGTATPTALSKAELTLLVNQFTASASGAVPATGAADGDSTKFLNAAGGWTTASGGGSPGGTGTEIQYRSGATTFGGITDMQFVSSIVNVKNTAFQIVDDAATPTHGVTFDFAGTSVIHAWTFPDTTDTFVGETYVQTIQNKTLGTGAAINLGSSVVGTMWYSGDPVGTLAELDPTGNGGKYLMLNASLIPEWTGISGGGIAIGDTITGATAGSVLFAGTAGVLAQENGDFYWDNTNKWLGIGTATPECGLHVVTSGSSDIKGVMNMHFDSTAANQAKFIGARARGNKNNPSALQADDAITSLSGRGYKATTWSNTVGGFYIYASENWTDSATGTYLTFRGVVPGATAVTEWGRLSNNGTTTTFNVGATSALDLTTAATTASIFNTTATTLNIGGAATTVNLGGGSGCAINIGGGASAGEIRLKEPSGSGTNYIAMKAQTMASDVTLTLPNSAGASGQILRTDGSGNLSWVNNNGGTLLNRYISSTAATVYPANTALGVFVSLYIPANTFASGSVFQIRTRIAKAGPGTSSTLRMGFNTTNASLNGITYFVASTTFGSGATPGLNERTISIESTTTSYQSSADGGWGGTTNTEITFSKAISSTTVIDWTVDQYFIIAAATAAGDTFTNNFITIIPQN